MIFAVACIDSVLIYDTENSKPIIVIGNIHYTTITDLAWKKDGTIFGISSSDGYCSFVVFEKEEFGEQLYAD